MPSDLADLTLLDCCGGSLTLAYMTATSAGPAFVSAAAASPPSMSTQNCKVRALELAIKMLIELSLSWQNPGRATVGYRWDVSLLRRSLSRQADLDFKQKPCSVLTDLRESLHTAQVVSALCAYVALHRC